MSTITARAPLRISFFGGGTDYPSWYSKRGGLVVGAAIQRYTHVELAKDPDGHTRIQSHGDLPDRSGLGSSASFAVALHHALSEERGTPVDATLLAEAAVHHERSTHGENTGIQDAIFSAFGGINSLRIACDGSYQLKRLKISADYKRELSSHALVGFTGITRDSSRVARAQVQNIRDGVIEDRMLALQDIAEEGLKQLERETSVRHVAELLQESWLIKRELSNQISNAAIDDALSAARAAGAWGGKLSGAGGGGFIFLLAPAKSWASIKTALPQIRLWSSVDWDEHGSRILEKPQSHVRKNAANAFA